MSELTVQVPVSLIEGHAAFLDRAGYTATANQMRALLSQPTPTAEPCGWCDATATGTAEWQGGGRHPSCGAHGHDYTGEPANLPSIADMVPGTTFTAAATSDIWRWAVRTDGQVVSGLGIGPKSSIDPSTIRDVTPPPAP